MSARYISDRFLPDKAIDVLDEACSKVSLKGFKVPEKIFDLEKTAQDLAVDLEEALVRGDVAEASLVRKERDEALKKLKQQKQRFQQKNADKKLVVTEEDIAEVVSQWTKIPVKKLAESESVRLNRLEETLHKRVVGQEEAVSAVARSIKRGRVGLKDPKRPIGSFCSWDPPVWGRQSFQRHFPRLCSELRIL